ncbi:MAG: flagellin [Burkholderiaceae bacterium]|jgi:flagellin
MSVINTNLKGLFSQAALKSTERAQATAMQQLSTGKRINSAKDDAAGLAISTRMTQQIRSLDQAVRNAGDAISLIQTAEGATNSITDMMQRMRELAIQAINDTNDNAQRSYLDLEFQQLKQEIVRIADMTEWNAFPVLNGTAGIPQGPQPVFKIAATGELSTTINYSTITESTREDIEQQKISFTAVDPAQQVLTFTATSGSAGTTFTVVTSGAGGLDAQTSTITLAAATVDAAAVGSAVATALNLDFASSGITREAVDNKDGTVTIIYRDSDGEAVTAAFTDGASATGVTMTAGSVTGSGKIYVGGVTVDVTAGMSESDVGSAVATALAAASAFSTSIIKNNSDGSVTITYDELDGDVELISFSAGSAIGITGTPETLTIADTEFDFANDGNFLKAGSFSFEINPTPLKQEILSLGPVSAAGTMVVGGVTATFASAMTAASAAAVVRSYLIAQPEWNFSASGRLIVDNEDGTLSITYSKEDADATALTVSASATANVVASVIPVSQYGSISARFAVDYGDPVTMRGTVDFSAGTILFAKESVAQVDDFTLAGDYTAGDVINFKLGAYEYAYTVSTSDASLAASALAVNVVKDMLNDEDITKVVDVALNRDVDITFTSVKPGQAFVATAVVSRATGSTATVAKETTRENIDAGENATVISDNLTVSLLDAAGKKANITYRAPSAVVDIGRSFQSLKALRNSDLIINGQTVSVSLPEYDKVSTSNTASSALAKATAINKISNLTGVKAVVKENVFTGTQMVPGDSVTGTISINGFTSPVITTVENNPRETRSNIVEAINRMTPHTGVVAVNTNDDLKGIVLKAADGRNIEVFFNTNSPDQVFAARTGLKQGLQSSVYALESKLETAIKVGTSSTGDITRSGLTAGDYVDNETVLVIDDRLAVNPPVAQVNEVELSGVIGTGETFSITINGRTKSFKTTASSNTFEDIRSRLITEINADPKLGVTATASNGDNLKSIFITSKNPGVDFTISVSTDSSDAYMDQSTVVANAAAEIKKLNTGDLVINGVAIPGSDDLSDIRTVEGALASRRNSSAIAIAAAINSQFEKSGVKAEYDNAVIKGSNTITGLPGVFPETGEQSLFLNGIEVKIMLTEDEPLDVRRQKVVNAINRQTYTHGVVASNNGSGVTLTSSDGRNVSAWFNADVEGLSAASFGLDAGGAVAQETSVTIGGTVDTTNDKATITINGLTITSEAATTASAADLAAKLFQAVQEKINSGLLTNITVTRDEVNSPEKLVVKSTVPGTGFQLSGAAATDADVTLAIASVKANSEGNNIVTAIRGGDTRSTAAKTVYSSLKLVAEKEFTVTAGANGFGPNSNFDELGFKEGTFGGRSSVEMSPPRVGRLTFQVGAKAGQEIYIDLADFGKGGPITSGITGDVDESLEKMTNRINTREGAQSVLERLDVAMDKINATRAVMGAVMNRLQYAIDNLSNVSTNSSASRSQIQDADYAKASTELARTQIMQQAGTAVLAQANMSQQSVLKLLNG